MIDIQIGFTLNNVILNGKAEAKEGRHFNPNTRLIKVEYNNLNEDNHADLIKISEE